jgi:hypothetical protein
MFTGMKQAPTRFELLLPPAHRRKLARLAADTGMSSADLVRFGIRWLLDHRELVLKPERTDDR